MLTELECESERALQELYPMFSITFDFADAATLAEVTSALQLTSTGLEGFSLENGGTTIDPNIWFIPDNLFQQMFGSTLPLNWQEYVPITPNIHDPPPPVPRPSNSHGEQRLSDSEGANSSFADIEAYRGTYHAEHEGASGSSSVVYPDTKHFGCDIPVGHFPTDQQLVFPEVLNGSLNQHMDIFHNDYGAHQIYPEPRMTSTGDPTIPPFQEASNQTFLGGYPNPRVSVHPYSGDTEEGKTERNDNIFDYAEHHKHSASGMSPVEQNDGTSASTAVRSNMQRPQIGMSPSGEGDAGSLYQTQTARHPKGSTRFQIRLARGTFDAHHLPALDAAARNGAVFERDDGELQSVGRKTRLIDGRRQRQAARTRLDTVTGKPMSQGLRPDCEGYKPKTRRNNSPNIPLGHYETSRPLYGAGVGDGLNTLEHIEDDNASDTSDYKPKQTMHPVLRDGIQGSGMYDPDLKPNATYFEERQRKQKTFKLGEIPIHGNFLNAMLEYSPTYA
ncbi:hypothetical protein JR316_0009301 [Psilocybe cubensis]|uniref:Uncharacterized protein n=2 Tax=Psilocybe cubensis TaxID=181762 RepID=A0ACB8GTC7_PSICU|nr:hypothetical protein JR316_0009301 [Psilocybe cubensis]KAH9478839.1 hypothetical protein JR316_0009301 [Psilocybe cubensis]